MNFLRDRITSASLFYTLKIRPKRDVPSGRNFYNFYNIMQIKPPLPSFIILSNVSCNFSCASSGIFISFVCKPSFTSSCRLLPNIFDSHIFFGSFSNSESNDSTNSYDCFSLPTIGDTSVSISALIMCIDGAFALSFTP